MNDNYENFMLREMIYGDYRCIAENDLCDDCGQRLDRCACESMSDWLRTVDSGEDVCVPASPEPPASNLPVLVLAHFGEPDAVARESAQQGRNTRDGAKPEHSRGGQSFSEWLESRGDSIVPASFEEWLKQTGDTIQ